MPNPRLFRNISTDFKPVSRAACLLVSLFALLLLPGRAMAHTEGLSGGRILFENGRVRVVGMFHLADMRLILPPRPDERYIPELCAKLMQLAAEDKAYQLELDYQAVTPSRVTARQGVEPAHIDIELEYPTASPPTALQLRVPLLAMLPERHRQFVECDDARVTPPARVGEETIDARGAQVVFTPPPPPTGAVGMPADTQPTTSPATQSAVTDALPPPAERPASVTFGRFFHLGVEHILTGYDHLLFLGALLLICRRFRDAAGIITCFTVAHSVTLGLAALDVVSLPGHFVEPAIAASIVYVAIENLVAGKRRKFTWRYIVTFTFGLIHGLGFAGALKEEGLSRLTGDIVLPLVGFNLGVESGQLAIAAVFLPMLLYLRRFPKVVRWAVPACSVCVGLMGAIWFVQRVFGAGE